MLVGHVGRTYFEVAKAPDDHATVSHPSATNGGCDAKNLLDMTALVARPISATVAGGVTI